jgi:ATP-dependent RNA helicase DeaD
MSILPPVVAAAVFSHFTPDTLRTMTENKKKSKASSSPPLFESFDLDPRILQAVADLSFTTPTPIQAEAIPLLLQGGDIIGQARTGSGKTLAFGLPLLHKLREGGKVAKALILAPTRELALQVTDMFRAAAKHLPDLRMTTIYGGASYTPQIRDLRRGVSIVVGTPGRIIDHLERGTLDLSGVETVVLDEGDEMLRMGFLDEVERILQATPDKTQFVLFSATMPPHIRKLAKKYQDQPTLVHVESAQLSVDHIKQRWMMVPERFKLDALARILGTADHEAVLVFSRTRASCAQHAESLVKRGIPADALHGDMPQSARERVVQRLRRGQLKVLVATDVAARGINVDHITHVINLELPPDLESYVHRIGRTGRAGREGRAITFITSKETHRIRALQKRLGVTIQKMQVPSDADVAKSQRNSLVTQLRQAMEAVERPEAESWLAELVTDQNLSERDIAVAALGLLASNNGFSLKMPEDGGRPAWSKQGPQQGPDKPRHGDSNAVSLFFAVGSNKGVTPRDFVGALTNELGLDYSSIGRIIILENKSFVGVCQEFGDWVAKEKPRLSIRGFDARVSINTDAEFLSQKDQGGPGKPRRRSGSYAGGPKGHRKFSGRGKRPRKPPASRGAPKGNPAKKRRDA